MCGILGTYQFKSATVNHSLLKKMADTLAHRGPESDGYWINENNTVGFGHRRLAIIDLTDSGKQPLHYEHLSITYNGEIYNYLELKKKLLDKGYKFKTNTDTEVILAAYIEYKESFLDQLEGMFAFIIYDNITQELIGARDRFGEKPMYYYLDKERFVFGSEMKAIFAAGVNVSVNDNMLFNYLAFGLVENPNNKYETFYKNIYQVPCSTYFKLNSQGEITFDKYWDIYPENQLDISIEDATEKYITLFENSINKRLRSDVSLGCSLSGGIDSSSIVSVIKNKNLTPTLNTFSARFKNINYDENYFIECLQNKYDFNAHYCWPGEDAIIDELETIFYHQEEPFGSASIIGQWEVMKLAKQKSVTVLLDGQGADETMAGYFKYFIPFLTELYSKNKNDFKTQLSLIEDTIDNRNLISKKFYFENKFPKTVKVASDLSRSFRIKNSAKDLSTDFLNTHLKQELSFKRINNLNEFLYFDTFNYGLGKLLRVADRNSMAFSREVRLPYLCHHLVEFVFSLPSHLKMNNGWSKFILRKSMEGIVTEEICWRKDKKGYQAPKPTLKNKKYNEIINESISKLSKDKYISSPDQENYWKYIEVNMLLNQKFKN